MIILLNDEDTAALQWTKPCFFVRSAGSHFFMVLVFNGHRTTCPYHIIAALLPELPREQHEHGEYLEPSDYHQEAQIDLDFSDVERAIDEYYERNGLQ